MAIKIDTEIVRTTASQIATVNRRIREDFSSVDTAIRNLDIRWEGSASDAAMAKFQNIKGMYCENRYNVISCMVDFMNRQVGDGYDNAEATIASAAAAFK